MGTVLGEQCGYCAARGNPADHPACHLPCRRCPMNGRPLYQPVEAFYRSAGRSRGRQSVCKLCSSKTLAQPTAPPAVVAVVVESEPAGRCLDAEPINRARALVTVRRTARHTCAVCHKVRLAAMLLDPNDPGANEPDGLCMLHQLASELLDENPTYTRRLLAIHERKRHGDVRRPPPLPDKD